MSTKQRDQLMGTFHSLRKDFRSAVLDVVVDDQLNEMERGYVLTVALNSAMEMTNEVRRALQEVAP